MKIRIKMDAKFQIITIYLGCLLLSRESLSQVIFPDGGFTTQPTTAITASNPYSTGNYQGNNNGYSPYGYNQGNNNGYSPYIQTSEKIKWKTKIVLTLHRSQE